jgi:hypothetical protein
MLLPEKHVSLAESILGLGGVVLAGLEKPRSVDQIYQIVISAREDGTLPAYHDFDSMLLAIVFLYSIGVVEATPPGTVSRCAS